MLGWNWQVRSIVRELEGYVAPGSELHDRGRRGAVWTTTIAELQRFLHRADRHASSVGHTNDRELLDSIDMSEFDHVVIVAYSGRMDVQRADGKTLVTLLHLRDIAEKQRPHLLDRQRDARRAEPGTGRGDARRRLHRQRPAGQPDLAQVAENKALERGLRRPLPPGRLGDLPASRRPTTSPGIGRSTSTRRRGRAAARPRSRSGYRSGANDNSAPATASSSIRPRRSPSTFGEDDRIIVLAED